MLPEHYTGVSRAVFAAPPDDERPRCTGAPDNRAAARDTRGRDGVDRWPGSSGSGSSPPAATVPGLNAAIRGFGKAAIGTHGMRLIGFRDGFRGLAEDRPMELDSSTLAGILTVGGTILGTSRDKPHRMTVDGVPQDMTGAIVRTYRRHRLDALLCIGGNGTAKNALRLVKAGLNIVLLPKTIDNDVVGTDATIGFATALGIATDAIDRLHSTAHSHHRIIWPRSWATGRAGSRSRRGSPAAPTSS